MNDMDIPPTNDEMFITAWNKEDSITISSRYSIGEQRAIRNDLIETEMKKLERFFKEVAKEEKAFTILAKITSTGYAERIEEIAKEYGCSAERRAIGMERIAGYIKRGADEERILRMIKTDDGFRNMIF